MLSKFDEAYEYYLKSEGGKVNNPKDPGGKTNMGVTQRVYDGWRKKQNLPTRDVYEITKTEVQAIYRFQYWEPIMGEQLPRGVGYVVGDGAINSGVGQSVKWLQRSLPAYTGPVDGIMGAGTLGAAIADNDNDALIGRIIDRRNEFLRKLKTFATFGKGWMRRTASVRKVGQAWATGSVPPVAAFVGGTEKAVVEDAKQAPGKGLADGATGGGIGSGVLAATLQKLQESLTPYSSAGDWIGHLVVILLIASAVLTIGGVLYRWWASRQKDKLEDALDLQAVSK